MVHVTASAYNKHVTYRLHHPDGAIREEWPDTPGWYVVRFVQRLARRGRVRPGSRITYAGQTVATVDDTGTVFMAERRADTG